MSGQLPKKMSLMNRLPGLLKSWHMQSSVAPTVGRMASGSGDFYARLKCGHDLTTRRAVRVTQRLSGHWPADLPWPSDIPRPTG